MSERWFIILRQVHCTCCHTEIPPRWRDGKIQWVRSKLSHLLWPDSSSDRPLKLAFPWNQPVSALDKRIHRWLYWHLSQLSSVFMCVVGLSGFRILQVCDCGWWESPHLANTDFSLLLKTNKTVLSLLRSKPHFLLPPVSQESTIVKYYFILLLRPPPLGSFPDLWNTITVQKVRFSIRGEQPRCCLTISWPQTALVMDWGAMMH